MKTRNTCIAEPPAARVWGRGGGGREGEAHKMSGLEGGESWSKLGILGGWALILEGDM